MLSVHCVLFSTPCRQAKFLWNPNLLHTNTLLWFFVYFMMKQDSILWTTFPTLFNINKKIVFVPTVVNSLFLLTDNCYEYETLYMWRIFSLFSLLDSKIQYSIVAKYLFSIYLNKNSTRNYKMNIFSKNWGCKS